MVSRGAAPGGGGEVVLRVPIVKQLEPIKMEDDGGRGEEGRAGDGGNEMAVGLGERRDLGLWVSRGNMRGRGGGNVCGGGDARRVFMKHGACSRKGLCVLEKSGGCRAFVSYVGYNRQAVSLLLRTKHQTNIHV